MYERILRLVAGEPWAILESKAEEIALFLELKAAGATLEWAGEPSKPLVVSFYDLDAEDLAADYLNAREVVVGADGVARMELKAASTGREGQQGTQIAVLPLMGTMHHRANLMSSMSGGVSTEMFGKEIDALAANPSIKGIVLDVDSPGGSVVGTAELAAKVRAAAQQKPVVAVANGMMASAAYWVGSQAGEVWSTESGSVGSIGVIAMHLDRSAQMEQEGVKPTILYRGKYKADGNPTAPLSESAIEEIQGSIDIAYDGFTKAVAKGRRVPLATARGAAFGEGRMVHASQAVSRGMADRIGTVEDAIRSIAAGRVKRLGADLDGVAMVTEELLADAAARITLAEAERLDARSPEQVRSDRTRFRDELMSAGINA